MSVRTTLVVIGLSAVVIAVVCGFLAGVLFRSTWYGPAGSNMAPPGEAPVPRGSRPGIVDASEGRAVGASGAWATARVVGQ